MPDGTLLPNLTFQGVEVGARESAWDLTYLLYHGGAAANTRRVGRMIAAGTLGKPVKERLSLVTKIHEVISGKLAGGGSMFTGINHIRCIRDLFTWAEDHDAALTLEAIQKTFVAWSDSLVHRHQIVKDLSQSSAYTKGVHAGYILDGVLNRDIPIISMTRLRMPPQRKTARGVKADKQNLAETFAFGHMLQDLCDGLPVDVVLKGKLPIRIPLRNGGEVVEWSGYPNHAAVEYHLNNAPPVSKKGRRRRYHRMSLGRFNAYSSEGTLRTRYTLANRRCEAELLMFIGQTGMNFAQAHKLKLRQFFYASHLDGYQVRDRKPRRGGDVLFEIFREYKPHFERYLDWRRTLFPESDALFPLVRKGGRSFQKHPQFALRKTCKAIGIRFVPPQELRNTRVNWLLRRSGDSEITAAMAQHAKTTLHDVYERPSQQRAMVEITRFWAKHDPTITRTAPPAPGECDGEPVPLAALPNNVKEPDCLRPSGCLWCEHHRDIDSEDYLWALACFRHLKVIEVSKWVPPRGSREVHPAEHVIDRISEKLRWFHSSNAKRRHWVDEALARVEEGNYHPSWARRIVAMEGAV